MLHDCRLCATTRRTPPPHDRTPSDRSAPLFQRRPLEIAVIAAAFLCANSSHAAAHTSLPPRPIAASRHLVARRSLSLIARPDSGACICASAKTPTRCLSRRLSSASPRNLQRLERIMMPPGKSPMSSMSIAAEPFKHSTVCEEMKQRSVSSLVIPALLAQMPFPCLVSRSCT